MIRRFRERVKEASNSATVVSSPVVSLENNLNVSGNVSGLNGVRTLGVSGAPSITRDDGFIVIDTTNHDFYFRSGGEWRNATAGYKTGGRLSFTANGNFVKSEYPGLKAIKVTVVGGGGGGGGAAATGTATISAGDGGAAGAYVEKFIPAPLLSANIAYVVGSGGTGGAGTNNGGNGGNTRFGTLQVSPAVNYDYALAEGGQGGTGATAGSAVFIRDDVPGGSFSTGNDGTDLLTQALAGVYRTGADGAYGKGGAHIASNRGTGGAGGSTIVGRGGGGNNSTATGSNGTAATGFGSGGSGAANSNSQSARTGGNGSAGIIFLELFY